MTRWLALLALLAVVGGTAIMEAAKPQPVLPQQRVVPSFPAQVSYYGWHPSLDFQPMAWGSIFDPSDPTIAASPLWPRSTPGDPNDPSWWGTTPFYGEATVLRLQSVAPPMPRDMQAWLELMWWGPPVVTVTIQDTCPACGAHLPDKVHIDLSPRAFLSLKPIGIPQRDWLGQGVVSVAIEVVK